MTILDRVYSLKQRPTYDLRINGVPIVPDQPLSLDGRPAVFSLRGGESYDENSRVASPPYLDLEVSRIPKNWMRKGMKVTLDAGYDLEHVRMFTGGTWALGEEDPTYLRTQVIGTGATAADGSRIEQTASLIGGPAVWPPIPVGQFIDTGIDNHFAWTDAKLAEIVARELTQRARIPRRPNDSKEHQTIRCKGDLCGAFSNFKIPARDLSGLTVQASIEGILKDSGVSQYNINVGSFTLASEGATVDRTPGAGMLTPLLQLQGGHVQQLKSGLVTGRVINMQPAPTAAFTYSATAQAYARIIAADPPMLRVPFNPLLQIGQTITLQLDYLGVDARFFLYAHEWEIGPNGDFSYLDLRGGDEFGGTVGINPIASFTYEVAQQVIGSALYYVLTFTDTSTDNDGTIDQSSSTWASNQTTTPNINTFNGKPVATIMIAAASVSGAFTVTRHVVDNTALTDDVTITLDLTAASSAVTVPPFFVAAGTRRMATPDGAQTFHDSTPASKTATAVGARLADGINTGHAVVGHSDGSLDVTRDFGVTWTAALAAVGSQFNDVVWDWRDHRLVWAITENGKLYLSNDYGASFFLLTDFRTITYGGFGGTTAGALGNIIGLPPGTGTYIFGGGGDGRPLIAYNVNPFAPGSQWIRVTFTGDLLTDLVTPADATMRIVSYAAPGYKGETMILSWASGGEATLVAVYHTNDAPGPARSFTRATGLTAGLKNGRVVMESGPLSPVSRIAMFGDRDAWQSTDGIAYTKVANVLPSGFTPNHGLFGSSVLTPMADVYEHLLAVEDSTGTGGVMKSIDDGTTWNFIRGPSTLVAWVSGAKAKKIAIGAPVKTSAKGSNIPPLVNVKQPATPAIKFPNATDSGWTSVNLPAGIVNTRPRPFAITETIWFVADVDGNYATSQTANAIVRTANGGATWANAAIGDETRSAPIKNGIQWVAKDAAGNIWGIRQTGSITSNPIKTEIFKSTDGGVTWVSKHATTNVPNSRRVPAGLCCHPTDANTICFFTDTGTAGHMMTAVTRDGGATWAEHDSSAFGVLADLGPHERSTMLQNGRLIFQHGSNSSGTTPQIWTSDDYGTTWTKRLDLAADQGALAGKNTTETKMVLLRMGASAANTYPYVCLDGVGTTWTALSGIDATALNIHDSVYGWDAWYDPDRDTLYVPMVDGSKIYALNPVDATGVWKDITGSWPGGGATSYASLLPLRGVT